MRPLALLVAVTAALAPMAAATLTDPLQNDAGSGGDAGDSAAEATRLVSPRSPPGTPPTSEGAYAGFAMVGDDGEDWYAFDVPASSDGPTRIEVALRGGSATCIGPELPAETSVMGLTLVSPDGKAYALEPRSPCGFHGKIIFDDANNGGWLLRVHIEPAAAAGLPASPLDGTEGSPPTLATDYQLVLDCEPRC